MTFITLILKNLWRNKGRTTLTLVGISIGIATIISLGVVADGLTRSFSAVMNTGRADFTVAQANASDLAFSAIDVKRLDAIRSLPGVQSVQPVLMGVAPVGQNPFFLVFGCTKASVGMNGFSVIEGRIFQSGADEILLGKLAAGSLHKEVGDDISISGHQFRIAGLFESGSNIQDGSALMLLGRLQRLIEREGKATLANVKVKPGTNLKALTARIDREFKDEFVTIKSVDEISRVDQGVDMAKAASWLISVLAVVIGGIGVMNTMIISVFDRIREIGVLKALGWRRASIIRMILGESLLVGLGSVVVGTVIGLGFIRLVFLSPMAKSIIEPGFSPLLWVRATVVALLVAVAGGAYPAFKAAGLSPVEALRYE